MKRFGKLAPLAASTIVLLCPFLLCFDGTANAVGSPQSAFTYQGSLKQSGTPSNATYDMQFRLYPSPTGGILLGSDVHPGVDVEDGLFTVQLDFGLGVFDGSERWLEIQIDADILAPRQPITATPYALFALSGNQGPEGPQGPQGPQGPEGPVGATGAQGPAGADGRAGAQGPAGVDGPAGPQGPEGPQGAQGPPGPQGETGAQGPQGIEGPQGDQGPQGPPGPAGTTGQNATTVFSSTSVTLNNATFLIVPGMSQTVNVPANSIVWLSTDGGVAVNSLSTTAYSVVDVVMRIDGLDPINAGYRRLYAANTTTITGVVENWSIAQALVLSAGNHTFSVHARLTAGNASASAGGDSNSVLQGQLTVMIVKQ